MFKCHLYKFISSEHPSIIAYQRHLSTPNNRIAKLRYGSRVELI